MGHVFIRRLLFFIIIILYFLTFLVPAFKSIPRIPAEKIYVYLLAFLMPVLKPQIFFTKEFLSCFLLIFIHLYYLATNNYENLNPRTTNTLAEIFLAIFFSMNLWLYIRLEKDFVKINSLGYILLGFIVITLITTSVGLFFYPTAVRDSVANSNVEEALFLLRLNIGSYAFQYLMVFIAPLAYYFYNSSKNKWWLILLLLIVFEVLYAQIVAIVLVLGLNLFLSVIILNRKMNMKNYLKGLAISGFLFFVFKGWFVQIIYFVADILPSKLEMVIIKFNELAFFLESGNQIDQGINSNMYQYQIRKDVSVNSFYNSPIIGGGDSGGHHFWIDLLAQHGILGIIPWLLTFFVFYRSASKIFNENEKIIILNSIIIFVIIGLNKNILIFSMPSFVFFVVPLLLFVFGSHKGRFNQKIDE